MIRVGSDAAAAHRAVHEDRGPTSCRPNRGRRTSELAQGPTGPERSAAVPLPSSTPLPWLAPFVAPLTFPLPCHDFVRFLRTSSTGQPSLANHPCRSHANDVNPQQPRHVHKPPAHKRQYGSRQARDRSARPAGASPVASHCSSWAIAIVVSRLRDRRFRASTLASCLARSHAERRPDSRASAAASPEEADVDRRRRAGCSHRPVATAPSTPTEDSALIWKSTSPAGNRATSGLWVRAAVWLATWCAVLRSGTRTVGVNKGPRSSPRAPSGLTNGALASRIGSAYNSSGHSHKKGDAYCMPSFGAIPGQGASELFDLLGQREEEVKSLIGGVPGFVSYAAFRTGGDALHDRDGLPRQDRHGRVLPPRRRVGQGERQHRRQPARDHGGEHGSPVLRSCTSGSPLEAGCS